MRILLTGATARSCKAEKFTRGKIWNVPETFRELWEANGVEVDQRVIKVGESFKESYDLAFVVAAPWGSMHSVFGLNTLYGLSELLASKTPTIVYFEDWRIKPAFLNAQSFGRIGVRQLHKTLGTRRLYYRTPEEDVRVHEAEIMEGARLFSDELWTQMVPLVPKFEGWGDLDVLGKTMFGAREHLRSIDPTPLILKWTDHDVTDAAEKGRRWVLASLPDHRPWLEKLGLEWPLDSYGGKYATHGRLMTEDAVFDEYTKHWGVLSPPYYHAGSGWCRARTVFAARARSILYAGPKDGAMLGPVFMYTPQQIEDLSLGGLTELAWDQAESIERRLIMSPEFTMAQFWRAFEEAREKAV